jgi:primosomal protein N''
MGQKIRCSIQGSMHRGQDFENRLEAALKERERLLKKNPKLVELQKEIDKRLANAGNFENRMAVLMIMMEDRLNALRDQMIVLGTKLRPQA